MKLTYLALATVAVAIAIGYAFQDRGLSSLASAGSSGTVPLADEIHGDANCDGVVDAADALEVLRQISHLSPATCWTNAGDVNCDRKLNSIDAMILLRYEAGLPAHTSPGCPTPGEPAPYYYVEVIERHDLNKYYQYIPDVPRIVFRAETRQELPCYHYPLPAAVSVEGDTIEITLGEIPQIEICATAIGPARAFRYLDLPEGKRNLIINSQFGQDRYQIEVTQSSIHLNPIASSVTAPMQTLFHRYPPNSFALYCNAWPVGKHRCAEFAWLLAAQLPVNEISRPPSGVWPYERLTTAQWYFTYSDDETWDAAGQLLADYYCSEVVGDSYLRFDLRNWLNLELSSWYLDKPEDVGPPSNPRCPSDP